MLKINLGSGTVAIKGWVNVDYAFGAHVARVPVVRQLGQATGVFRQTWSHEILIHDLRKRLPWNEGEVDYVFCSHTLEHFNKEDGLRLLQEAFRVLRKGGAARFIVPDLRYVIDRYINGVIPAEDVIINLDVLDEEPSDGKLKRLLAPFVRFPHKCMYDDPALVRIMRAVGFDAQAKKAYQSQIPDIEEIELEGRTLNAVIVEGVKP